MNSILKQFSFLVVAVGAMAACSGSGGKGHGNSTDQVPDTGKPVLTFTEYEHDFGKVNEGEKVGCIFSFRNTGTGDLVINSATTSCGCTVPKYSAKPIPPDKSGTLEVVFNTEGRNGIQTKTITIKSNATVPVILLKITAEVVMHDARN